MTTAIEMNDSTAADAHIHTWTDRQVLDACIARDQGAWRELVRRYDDGLRGTVHKCLSRYIDRLPSDFRDDVMGALWLKLIERDMKALRCFNWGTGSALFSWLALLVNQCAIDYLRAELDRPTFVPVKDAHGVADEGGVLASGCKPIKGSLSARARHLNDKRARTAQKADRTRCKQRRAQRRACKRSWA